MLCKVMKKIPFLDMLKICCFFFYIYRLREREKGFIMRALLAEPVWICMAAP